MNSQRVKSNPSDGHCRKPELFDRLKIELEWPYSWILELDRMDRWWKATTDGDLQADITSVFSFRDSKIHLLKKIREKLHRIQTETVSD